jgi:hypothetical protein
MPRRNVFNADYTVIDAKQAPQNCLEQVEKRFVKMNRIIQSKFKDRAAFEKQLKEKAGCDANNNLNVDDFKAFVVEACREDLIARNVSKSDIEGFLSAFTFNSHGGTDIEKVAPILYEKDPNAIALNLVSRVRPNPPPALANEDLGSTVQSFSHCDNETQKRLRSLLVQLEDKVFDSKPRFYHVFKQMDLDNDGFISYKDFEQHLEKQKVIATKEEIVTLMHNVLDVEKKGYIDFPTFQKRFRPRMSDQVKVEENELHSNNMMPTREKLEEYGQK